ncbi:hypothetical protein IWQ62_003285 [Dispira parvispora]|uniref:Cytochrome P450 n=1 Tax=Dispira parvispora TaxID=1520584 RepID=A0A9W8AV38_9FUNG|nr:hypothetical protein IWQ62_003285 [Dispira parvispora]
MGWITNAANNVYYTFFPGDGSGYSSGEMVRGALAYQVGLTLVLLWVVRLLYLKFCLPVSKLPAPWYVGLTELDLIIRLLSGRSFAILHRRHCRYGPIMRIGTWSVSISDCKLAKELLATHAFRKPSNIYEIFFQIYLPNIFTTSDPVFHRKRKRMLAPVFSWQSLHQVEGLIVEEGVQPLLDKFQSLPQGAEVNLYQEFLGLTYDVIGRLAFGESFGVILRGDRTVIDEFTQLFQYLTVVRLFPFLKGRRVPFIPFLRRGYDSEQSIVKKACRAVEKRLEWLASTDQPPPQDTLQLMIDSVDPETGDKLNPAELGSESIVQLIGGTDTTAHGLTWVFYAMLSHPGCYQRVVDEILEEFPLSTSERSPSVISFDAIKDKLPYLDAVIQEALRVYPPVSLAVVRTIPDQGATIGGYYIPPGYNLGIPVYSINHSPLYWDKPNEFIPERWLEGDAAQMKQNTITFLSGPRGCLGRNLAYMELYLTVANLLRNFHVKFVNPDNPDVEPVEFVTLRPKNRRLMTYVTPRTP